MSLIQSNHGFGTAFSIDVDGKEYWITAKHIVTGAKHPPYGKINERSVRLKLLDPAAEHERWLSVTFTVIDPGNDIDIAVLAPPNPLLVKPMPSVKTTIAGVMLGGDCEFLGFPSAAGSVWTANLEEGKHYVMPFVKHCYISSLPTTEAKVMILDGVNNPGFSGGPVLYHTGDQQQIVAVISGIVTEPSEVIPALATKKAARPAATHAKEQVQANSGFIVAYAINTAIDAINKTPIGPTRMP